MAKGRKTKQMVTLDIKPENSKALVVVNNNNRGKNSKKGKSRRLARALNEAKLNNAFIADSYETDLEQSVNRTVQSLFYPDIGGVHRGLANAGFSATGLAYFKGYYDVTTTTALPALTLGVRPAQLSAAGWFSYQVAAANGSPYATPTVAATALITSTNATDARCVSCEINIVPTGALLNQQGDGIVAYVPDDAGFGYTQGAAEQLMIQESCNAQTTMRLHWVPSYAGGINEASLRPVSTTLVNGSALTFIFVGAPSSYRIEYKVGVEFVPTDAIRPYIERKSPTNHPDVYYYVNKMCNSHWKPLIVASDSEYSVAYNKESSAVGHPPIGVFNGIGSNTNGAMQPENETENSFVNSAWSSTRRALQDAKCRAAEAYGLDCDNVAGGIASKAIGYGIGYGTKALLGAMKQKMGAQRLYLQN